MDGALAWGIIGALFGSLLTLLLFVMPYTNKLAEVSSKLDGFCNDIKQINAQLTDVPTTKQKVEDVRERLQKVETVVFHEK